MAFENQLIEETPLMDLLIFLSTISNVWLISVIFYEKRHWQSGYLLLLHLSGKNMFCGQRTTDNWFITEDLKFPAISLKVAVTQKKSVPDNSFYFTTLAEKLLKKIKTLLFMLGAL